MTKYPSCDLFNPRLNFISIQGMMNFIFDKLFARKTAFMIMRQDFLNLYLRHELFNV